MKPEILLVGGNGFLGSYLVDALLAADHIVRVLDAMPERFRAPVLGVKYFNGSSVDSAVTQAALTGCEVLLHLAHSVLPPASPQQSEEDVQRSGRAFAVFLEQAVRCGVRKVLFFSSGGAVYGEPQRCPISEAADCLPISPYGRAKLLMEQTLARFRQTHGLDYIVARPSNPFGPRQDFRGQQGVIPIFLHRLMTGQPISIWGDGLAVKDYLYVADLAAAVLALMHAGFDNTVYNIGSGSGTSLRGILAMLEAETGRRAKVEYSSAHATDVKNNVLAVGKLVARTGWHPRTSLQEGVRLTRRWYEDTIGTP
jgi:UDP-glucose 4-epimerase